MTEIDALTQKYAREYSPTGDKYYSSAEQFAKYLNIHKINSPIEIRHKYVLPEGMNSTDFFNVVRRLDFLNYHFNVLFH